MTLQDPLSLFARLAEESFVPEGLPPSTLVSWSAQAELRQGTGTQAEPWLHLQAAAAIPLCCQRCLQPVEVGLDVDRWFRFVADEASAEAQDDECEEDVLALDPRPSLRELVEDELLMAVPLVPMHGSCPQLPPQLLREDAGDNMTESRPNPFAALTSLKRGSD